MSNRLMGLWDSRENSRVLVLENSRRSSFSGRKALSQRQPSRALKRWYAVWNPRFAIPTEYEFGYTRHTFTRPPGSLWTAPCSLERMSFAFFLSLQVMPKTSGSFYNGARIKAGEISLPPNNKIIP